MATPQPTEHARPPGGPRRIAWLLLSVPIQGKVLGMAFGLTALVSGVAFYQIGVGMYRAHYRVHGQMAQSVANSLAARVAPFLGMNDMAGVDAELNQTMASFPEVRHIVVQDAGGAILSHGFTFPREAPLDLVQDGRRCLVCHTSLPSTQIPEPLRELARPTRVEGRFVRSYRRGERVLLEVTAPVGSAGRVLRLAVGDTILSREVRDMSRQLFLSLAACVAAGLAVAFALAHFLVRPLRTLLQATNRIREGDFRARADIHSADEVGVLAAAFNGMGASLENYQRAVEEKEAARVSLMRKIVEAQEEERRTIARELHDQIGQSLSNVLLTARVKGGESTPCGNQLVSVREEIHGIIDQVRQLAWAMRPTILDDYGLDSALKRYVDETSQRVNFPIEYESALPPGRDRFEPQVEVTLYRIVQEALTNIIRHAAPRQVSIVLLLHGAEACVIIEDDGKGFDYEAAMKRERPPLGLLGMRERAALVGGSLEVETAPGKGAVVRVRIPVTEVHKNDAHPDR